jgi:hypothetical protein
MCMICRMWDDKQMTNEEAFKAIGELKHRDMTPEEYAHWFELADRIIESEIPFVERNNDVEKLAIDLVEDEKKDKYGSS